MPAQQTTGGLFAKYGAALDVAVKKSAGATTTIGRSGPPPGIVNGVAQLDQCGFKQYEKGLWKGEYYFFARGIIKTPESVMVDGYPVKARGCHTYFQLNGMNGIPVCATKSKDGTKITTQEEHVADIMAVLRTLGVNTVGKGGAHLEQMAAALQAAKPHFRIDTSKRDARTYEVFENGVKVTKTSEAGVWENWGAVIPGFVAPNLAAGAVQDDSAGSTTDGRGHANGQTNGSAAPAQSSAPVNRVAQQTRAASTKPVPEPVIEEPQAVEFSEFEDISSLVERANNNDQQAQQSLIELAVAAGYDDDTVKAADTWEAVAEMTQGQTETAAEEPQAVEVVEEVIEEVIEESPFKIGNCFRFKAADPTTKKPETVPVEIVSVNEVKGTVGIKHLKEPKRQWRNVPFAQLLE